MNNDRVVTVEKKGSNKLGLFILILVVIAGLGFGAYFYITNKSTISFTFPWQKEEEKEEVKEEKVIVDGQEISKKTKEEKTLERQSFDVNLNSDFYEENGVHFQIASNELKEGAYILKIKMINQSEGDYSAKVKAVIVNGFQISQTFNLFASIGKETTYELVLPAQELDKNRIDILTEIKLIADVSHLGETNEKNIVISTGSNSFKSDISPIATIDKVNRQLEVQYYKKVETSDSTKLYFLFNNKTTENYTYYIERLSVNDKDVDASQYHDVIYSGVKYIPVIELQKNLLSQNKKIRISFIFQNDNKSIYKTVEKELQI